MLSRIYCLLACLLLITGCAHQAPKTGHSTPTVPPASQYDSIIVDADTGHQVSLDALIRELAGADIIVIGEYHGHHGSHLLQARLLTALHQQNPDLILSMEQFNLDHQSALDAYLAGDTGEAELIEDAKAWDNYRGSYRPLVEFARQHRLPVIAANAPADIVRCVGREGKTYLSKLGPAQLAALPAQAFLETPAYRQKFVDTISGSHGAAETELSGRLLTTYQAQLLRDNTMAHRMLQALAAHPGHTLVHTTGTFHSAQRLGTVTALEQRAPELTIVVLTPIEWPAKRPELPLAGNQNKGDYLYYIQPLPTEFRNKEREREAMKVRFANRPDSNCQ